MTEVNRSGRLIDEDKEYIIANYQKLSIEEIARVLKRNPKTIKSFIKENCIDLSTRFANEEFNIRKTPMWDELSLQFDTDEQESFLYHWNNIITQFKYDVYPTEKMQVIDVVRNEILLGRVLRKMRSFADTMKEIDSELLKERELDVEVRDKDRIAHLESMKASIIAAEQSLAKEYKDLFEKKQSSIKEIKGSRSERAKRIEDSKETFTSWIAMLISDVELRKKLGIEIEKFRLATQVELERLSEYHTYMDGEVEQPVLDAQTVKDDNI